MQAAIDKMRLSVNALRLGGFGVGHRVKIRAVEIEAERTRGVAGENVVPAPIAGVGDGPVRAVFIRAPWVERTGPGVTVLARVGGHPVAVRQGSVLATSFHPEVSGDDRLHALFLQMVRGS